MTSLSSLPAAERISRGVFRFSHWRRGLIAYPRLLAASSPVGRPGKADQSRRAGAHRPLAAFANNRRVSPLAGRLSRIRDARVTRSRHPGVAFQGGPRALAPLGSGAVLKQVPLPARARHDKQAIRRARHPVDAWSAGISNERPLRRSFRRRGDKRGPPREAQGRHGCGRRREPAERQRRSGAASGGASRDLPHPSVRGTARRTQACRMAEPMKHRRRTRVNRRRALRPAGVRPERFGRWTSSSSAQRGALRCSSRPCWPSWPSPLRRTPG